MPSSYSSNVGIELPANGEQAGTWGNVVNSNMAIIDRLTSGVGYNYLTGTTGTISIANAILSDGHYPVAVLHPLIRLRIFLAHLQIYLLCSAGPLLDRLQ